MFRLRCKLFAVLCLCCAGSVSADDADWESYNKTLKSERFSPLDEITRDNVNTLDTVCSYDTGQQVAFHTGPLVVDDTIYATTETDTFALNAANCEERWRVSEDIKQSYLRTNRGVAYEDGRLFRGLQDGRVVAYDADDGSRLWERRIGDADLGESVPAAPITWEGLVFIGNAGGDNYGVKGRMYALNAETGEVVWEFYLVPKDSGGANSGPGKPAVRKSGPTVERGLHQEMRKSWDNEPNVPVSGGATWTSYTIDPEAGLLYVPGGNPAPDFVPQLRPGNNLLTNSVVVLDARTGEYRKHYQLVPEDFHDWDVAAAPVLFTAPSGRRMLVAAPKNGLLYGYDRESGERLYAEPITRRENTEAPLTRDGTRFCPGTQGGAEWNGPAYDPETGLVYTGAVDWCTTVQLSNPQQILNASAGQPWTGANPENAFGSMDSPDRWAGWVYARNAESGKQVWRFETPAPILSAVTPTGGKLLFLGDMAGNAYALDAESGEKLWSSDLGAAVAGGIISYEVNGRQRIAFAAGMKSPIWPTAEKTGRIVVLGLRE